MKMGPGYVGKFLNVNLSEGNTRIEPLDESILRRFISGRGLGTKLLYDQAPTDVDPLSQENVIVLTTGVLTGTLSLFSSRTNISTKSPLTNRICMGNCGGYFGPELKFAGFDGIMITGKAEKLSYLWIHDGEVEIRECEELSGKTAPEAEEHLQEQTAKGSRVLCIGPAGERLVKISCVYGDDRFVGRGGTGAVFGSKNLKGIVTHGPKVKTIPVFDDTRFREVIKREQKLYDENEFFQLWRKTGTPFIVEPMNGLGIMGTRNFQEGTFEVYQQISGDTLREYFVQKKVTCHRCPVACISMSEVKDGTYQGAHCRGPEFETIYAFGSDCGVSSLPAIIMADKLCTDYGMDTISTGNICAFAMELFERGLLTKEDTGGLELQFGNQEAMIELIHFIGKKEGIGKILGEGVREAAKTVGKGAEDYAIHVKGLELAAYDPRGAKSQGLAYATSPRGGCHHTGYAEQELYDGSFDRFTIEGKAAVAIQNQDKSVLFDSTGICAFPTQLGVVGLDTMAELLFYATGFEDFRTDAQLMKIGERIFNLERLFNWREGMTSEEDTLPKRFTTETHRAGASAGQTVDIASMLNEYYKLRNWSSEGKPTQNLLDQLELP
jgi:aldehyde:ferredoxin oxidoreductase